jgi:hypothetical protein
VGCDISYIPVPWCASRGRLAPAIPNPARKALRDIMI